MKYETLPFQNEHTHSGSVDDFIETSQRTKTKKILFRIMDTFDSCCFFLSLALHFSLCIEETTLKAILSVQLFWDAAELNGSKWAANFLPMASVIIYILQSKYKYESKRLFTSALFQFQSRYSCIFDCLRLTFGPWNGCSSFRFCWIG